MATRRSNRKTNPATYILAALLLFGFYLFFFSSDTIPESFVEKHSQKRTASHILSPASVPFLRPKKDNGNQPPPPVVHYQMNNITATSTPIENRESILILTPMSRFFPGYWENLVKLNYPHDLISLGFILPKDAAGNAATKQLQEIITAHQTTGPKSSRFSSITILRQDFDPPLLSQDEAERHKMVNQKVRRAAMARARNSLLFTTLGPATAWVLWLDSDIVETPPSLLQDLASHDKPIIVPNCYQRYFNTDEQKMAVRPYDYNSWIDSDVARQLAQDMDKDDILLEGYAEMATYRTLMAYMHTDDDYASNKGDEVPLDGVGGTALLVKADVHRDGAMFPPFAFYHLIETEGFAKMAKRLGWQSWGLPHYFVYHYNE